MNQSQKTAREFQYEQRLAHDAMTEKTARLRELRLAKEAAGQAAAVAGAKDHGQEKYHGQEAAVAAGRRNSAKLGC